MNVGDRVKGHTDATSEFVIVSIGGEDAVIESVICPRCSAVQIPHPGVIGDAEHDHHPGRPDPGSAHVRGEDVGDE